MDKNSIIGLVLIFLILITFAYINQPSQEEIARQQHIQDSIALINKQNSVKSKVENDKQEPSVQTIDTVALKTTYGDFASLTNKEETFTTLENEELKIVFTNKGARVYSVTLKKHKRYNGNDLVLFEGNNNRFDYDFVIQNNTTINSASLFFTPQVLNNGNNVSFKAQVGLNQYIEHTYTLTENANKVNFNISFNGLKQLITLPDKMLTVNWQTYIPQQEKTHEAEQRTTTIYFKTKDGEPDYISETSDGNKKVESPVHWLAYKQQFFNTFLITDNAINSAEIETKTDETKEYVKLLKSSFTVPVSDLNTSSQSFAFYFGTNQFKELEKLNIQAERIIPLGWGIFRWVNKYFTVNVFHWLGQYLVNMGLIIFLLTLIVKTILFPLVYRSYLSAAKMRILKPELDEIKAKYETDMAKLQQENMKLYRKAGVNPMGGCIPVLLQMPILIAMFQFFPSAFDLRQKGFLWSDDLSTYDSIFTLPINIPFYGDHVSLFTLLMTVSTLIYTVYNNQMTGVSGQMKWMSYLMPVMFLGFFNNYASGLTYYYFVSNLFTIGQQLAIKAFVDEDKLHAQIQENKKKPVTKSKFQQKLEEMAQKRGFDPKKLNK
ncbi:MAG: membrane protein insertase YidC [Bacteroidia bacterium]